ncbi:MAG: hypothetical protein ACYCUD_06445 [Candidatus Dormibacteria bacterium]
MAALELLGLPLTQLLVGRAELRGRRTRLQVAPVEPDWAHHLPLVGAVKLG